MSISVPSNFDQILGYLRGGPMPGQEQTQEGPVATPEVKELTPAAAPSPAGTTANTTTTATPTLTTPAPATTTPATTPSAATLPAQTGPVIDRLFNPLKTGATQAKGQIQDLSSAFQAAAGPAPDYGQATTVLQQAVQPTATPETLGKAKGLVGATYTGPAGLNPDQLAALNESLGNIYTTGQAIGTGKGLASQINEVMPGMTTGERSYEAQQLLQDQEYLRQLGATQTEIQEILGQRDVAVKSATDLAAQRTKEEADLAARSKAFLETSLGGVKSDIQKAIDAANAQQAAVTNQYQSGQIPADIAAQVAAAPANQEAAAAQAAWKGIMDKYADIKDVPLLVPSMDQKGREILVLPAEYAATNPGINIRWEDMPLDFLQEQAKANTPEGKGARVVARQRELEALFSPVGYEGTKRGPGALQAEEGKYSKYMPLYGADTNPMDTEVPTWTAPDVHSFLKFDPGNMPTPANASTEEQRTVYNNIQNILGEADKLDAAGEPLRAASIILDVQNYLAKEKANLDQWDQLPTQEMQDWKKQVDRLNSKMKKAKRSSILSSIITIGSFISPAPLASAAGGALINEILFGKPGDVSFGRNVRAGAPPPVEPQTPPKAQGV